MSGRKLLDLGVDSVHVPSATPDKRKPMASTKKPLAKPARGLPPKGKKKLPPGAPGNEKRLKRVSVRADIAPGGSMHVRHHLREIVLGDEVEPESVGITCRDPGTKLVWIQIAEAGSFRGHPQGEFALTPGVFSEIVANYQKDGILVPIDAEHASEMPASSGSIPAIGAPAHGWIHRLEARGDTLWGLVEWLEPARSYIKEGRYKYLSPAIALRTKDRVTGKPQGAKLTSAAITNQPFLKGMQPLAARDRTRTEDVGIGESGVLVVEPGEEPRAFTAKEVLPDIRKAMRLSEIASATECDEQLQRLRENFDEDPTLSDEAVASMMRSLRDVTRVSLSASWCDVFDTVQDMIDAALGRHVLEYHSDPDSSGQLPDDPDGDPDDVMGASTLTEQPKETTMTISEKEALTLKGANDQLTKDLEIERASNAAAKKKLLTDTGLKSIDEVVAEVNSLREFKAKAEEAEANRIVDEAFVSYEKTRNLTAAQKPMLLRQYKADPEAFAALFPKVDATKRTLTERVIPTEPRDRTPPSILDASEPGVESISVVALAKKLMSSKGLSYPAAVAEADRIRRAQSAQR